MSGSIKSVTWLAQKVLWQFAVTVESAGDQASTEGGLKFFANPNLLGECLCRICLYEAKPVVRNPNFYHMLGRRRCGLPTRELHDPVAVEMPLGEEPITSEPKPLTCWFGCGRIIRAVKILRVFVSHRAEFLEIEIRVSRLHWLEGPLHEAHAFLERPLSLGPFQTPADTVALVRGSYGGHMRIKRAFASQKCRDAQHKSD